MTEPTTEIDGEVIEDITGKGRKEGETALPDKPANRTSKDKLLAFRDKVAVRGETETVQDAGLPHKLYTPIIWYQTHFPQAITSDAEVGSVLIDSVRKGESLEDLLQIQASAKQIDAAARALTAKHRALGIQEIAASTLPENVLPGERPIIESSQINKIVFEQSMQAALDQLLDKIGVTPIGPTLQHQIPMEGAIDTARIERIAEFIEKGGPWVDIVAEGCRIEGESFRSTPKDMLEAFQRATVYERENDIHSPALNDMSSDDPRIVHTRIPVLKEIEDRKNSAVRAGIWSVVPDAVDPRDVNNYLDSSPRLYHEK